MLDNIRIVMIGTTHPGNIGAAARAMKTMGLSRLVLVAPERFPHADASSRASGADDVLASATVCSGLDEALEGCQLVVGASARLRSLEWPLLDPGEMAGKVVAEAARAPVALLFGREHSGLSNEELSRCHFLVNIPANPDFSSLNIAAAVQVLCWELRRGTGAVPRLTEKTRHELDQPAPADEMEGFFGHLERTLVDIDFLDPANPGQMMHRLRRLYQRSRPDRRELNILRGILTAVEKSADGKDS
jgi:TrmH family RNA methyltransferase